MTSQVSYLGHLRTSSKHLQSGSILISDAPTDNHGKGEAFSPTDTVANALASCILTTMGIKADTMAIDLTGSTADVTKYMASDPRRISKIEIVFNMSISVDEKTRAILERIACTCPVFYSLHPDVEKPMTFNWKEN